MLLKDAKHILVQQTEESQSVRIIRFSNTEEIIKLALSQGVHRMKWLKKNRAGLKVKLEKDFR